MKHWAVLLFFLILLKEYRAEKLQLGSEFIPVGAKINFDTSLSGKLQTYIDNEIDVKTQQMFSEVIERSLSEMVANVTERVIKRIQENNRINVIFHAVKSSAASYGNKDVIVFDSVELNTGQAYDAQSGKFTAPYNGLYIFTSRVTTIHGKHIHIALVKNGEIVSVSWAVDDTAIITETLVIDQGDKIWVWHNRDAQESVYPTYTLFGGSLIRMM